MLISEAYAQAAGGAGGGEFIGGILPLVLIFVVFYFLLIRPQQKKMKNHRNMVAALRRGDKVVTGGGLIGTVSKVVSDGELQVEVAEGVKVRVVRGTISEVLSKPEPAKESGGKPANDPGAPAEKPGGMVSGLLGNLFGGPKKN
jgi:preprotein translocase subunit YajC